jgi:hypothetical protein
LQTFLPMVTGFGINRGGFPGCALVLDNKRLGKQRVECVQILNTLEGRSKGWRHHPAVLMWAGHEVCLRVYLNCIIDEWVNRGFKNSIPLYLLGPEVDRQLESGEYFPEWFKDDSVISRVASSHRSNLLRKDPEWYGQFGWKEPDNLPYVWPVTKADIQIKRVMEFCA